MLELETHAMGSTVRVLLESDPLGVLSRVVRWFERWEQIFSRFRPDSELSRLNARGTARVSEELFEVLSRAVAVARESDGLVTPMVLPALLAAGYTKSFELLSDEGKERRVAVADVSSVELDVERRVVKLGAAVDLSGFVKGWAADRAARVLGRSGPVLVDVGGDIAVSGAPFRIAVDHPDGSTISELELAAGGIATSGRDHRTWRGGAAHHLIDPRRGLPADTDVLSATVIAPSAWDAEHAAKRVLLLGTRAGLSWIESRPELAALVVGEQGTSKSSHFPRSSA
ncbi:MAG: FAD:protein FMN transferase [Myxococcales bacterium]|nr:FAD:protein FMN transferase [Myxococcales bacterium]